MYSWVLFAWRCSLRDLSCSELTMSGRERVRAGRNHSTQMHRFGKRHLRHSANSIGETG